MLILKKYSLFMSISYSEILDEIVKEVLQNSNDGEIASYILELASISPEKFGIHYYNINVDLSIF